MVYPHDEVLISYKRNEVPTHAPTWMKLENIILNEKSHAWHLRERFRPFFLMTTTASLDPLVQIELLSAPSQQGAMMHADVS